MNSPDLERRFSWQTFARSLLTAAAVLGLLEAYWYWSSGGWKSSNLIVLVVFAWVFVAYAWRWRKFREQLKDGTFQEDQYRANPTAFYMGSPKQRRVVIVVGVGIAIIWATYETLRKT